MKNDIDIEEKLYSIHPKIGDIIVYEVDVDKIPFNDAINRFAELVTGLPDIFNTCGAIILPKESNLKLMDKDELTMFRDYINELIKIYDKNDKCT